RRGLSPSPEEAGARGDFLAAFRRSAARNLRVHKPARLGLTLGFDLTCTFTFKDAKSYKTFRIAQTFLPDQPATVSQPQSSARVWMISRPRPDSSSGSGCRATGAPSAAGSVSQTSTMSR